MKKKFFKKGVPVTLLVLILILFAAHITNVFMFRKEQNEIKKIESISAKKEENKRIIQDSAKAIIAYGLDLWHGVDHLRNIHGCKSYKISFERKIETENPKTHAKYDSTLGVNPEAPENGKCSLFDKKNGAQKTFRNQFEQIKLSKPAIFSAQFQILDMRSPKYKSNRHNNNDLAMYMFLSKDICQEINNQLGMTKQGFVLEKDLPTEEFKGTFRKNKTYAAPDDGETAEGITTLFRKKADQMGCWKHKDSDTYIFYVTLVKRES